MYYFIINQNADENGRNEIHNFFVCEHLPASHNRITLGWFTSEYEALQYARCNGFPNADGCYYCCNNIHHG